MIVFINDQLIYPRVKSAKTACRHARDRFALGQVQQRWFVYHFDNIRYLYDVWPIPTAAATDDLNIVNGSDIFYLVARLFFIQVRYLVCPRPSQMA